MSTQKEKGLAFRELHAQPGTFVIPNPWGMGSVKILVALGFKALATTSSGSAFGRGKRDGALGRDAVLGHLAEIVSASDLPVSADLENGFADDPKTVAETIKLAAAHGIVGGSIEDFTGKKEDPIYELGLAVERVRAAAEAAAALPFPFTLTGRAENHVRGRPDLKDTIRRLQAYQDAGAQVLFAPGVSSRADIETLVKSVDRPVNFLIGHGGKDLTVKDLAGMGVKRISTGGALCRAAIGGFLDAAREIADHGTFHFVDKAPSFAEINPMLDS